MTIIEPIKTHGALIKGRRLIVLIPGGELETDLRSEKDALKVCRFIRQHGVGCTVKDLNNLLDEFSGT